MHQGSRVGWYAMARERKLLGRHVDASLKDEKRVRQFAAAYVKTTRSKESMMTLAFPQAMQPVDHNRPYEFAAAPAPSAAGSAQWQPSDSQRLLELSGTCTTPFTILPP